MKTSRRRSILLLLLGLAVLCLAAGPIYLALRLVVNQRRPDCDEGQNMTNPRLVYDSGPVGAEYDIRLVWEPGTGLGADLDDAYFKAATFVDDSGTLQSVQLTGANELTLHFRGLPAYLATRAGTDAAVNITLNFPDRIKYVDCYHPGMADVYQLLVFVRFDDNLQVMSSRLQERVQLGPM